MSGRTGCPQRGAVLAFLAGDEPGTAPSFFAARVAQARPARIDAGRLHAALGSGAEGIPRAQCARARTAFLRPGQSARGRAALEFQHSARGRLSRAEPRRAAASRKPRTAFWPFPLPLRRAVPPASWPAARPIPRGQRLLQARQLLAYTNQTLSQIADQLGFSSPFYLSLRFKKHYGLSPRFFRRQGPR